MRVRAVLGLLLVAALAAGAADHPAMKSARSPEMTEMFGRLAKACSREDESALRELAVKLADYARQHPNDAEAHFGAARAHLALLNLYVLRDQKDPARQEMDVALKFINRSIELDAERPEAFALRAQLYGWKVALTNVLARPFVGISYGSKIDDDLDRARRLDPQNTSLHLSMGMKDYYRPAAAGGSLDRAVHCFRQAIELDKDNPDAWLWLGLALKAQKKLPEAKAAFEKVLKLDPDNARARRELSALK